MNKRYWNRLALKCCRRTSLLAFVAVVTLLNAAPAHCAEPPRLNVVVILADDLGYGDLACNGNPYVETPNLDRLVKEGVRLTSFYAAAPVCSPTRGALLTGRLPQRNGVTNVLPNDDESAALPREEVLLSELLQQQAYRTGIFGKWHLGAGVGARPQQRGFDVFFGGLLGGLDFFNHRSEAHHHDLWENDNAVRHDGSYITDLMAQQASSFVDKYATRPFFLYVPFHAVHLAMGPDSRQTIQAPQRWLDHYAKLDRTAKLSEENRTMLACISAMDEAVGEILKALDRNKLSDHTLVLFTSDNGPLTTAGSSAGPLRGGKHTLWEGGIRVPTIVRWPGKIPAGSTVDVPATVMDIMPTVLAATGVAPAANRKLDGENILPILTGEKTELPRTLYWSYIRTVLRPSREQAVRRGDWKWLNGELYNLRTDPGETKNLAATEPKIVAELSEAWKTWLAQFPTEASRWGDKPPIRGPESKKPKGKRKNKDGQDKQD
ncbi:MAG: sulfatase [Planctomycetota bacterium]|nr:sulfatase [Planctomycetota bacterium]